MILLIRLFIISILFLNTLDDKPKDKSIFISPVRIPQLLSANFGELRIDHFHSGLDIKTQGVTGKEVVSAADGYIYRISITAGGFGNALYIKHPSGYTTVYGHLDRFITKIDDYVTAQQYEKKSFQITLFPGRDEFPVKQGELIAYSGNSGSSGGPHLHFEVRKADSEKPINPLLFDFGMTDNIAPVFEKLFIYPINHNSLINNQNSIKKINVTGSHGDYSLPQDYQMRISGLTGFGIKAYDLLNDSYNRCAVYSIELKIDSSSIFKYIMDSFSFNESRYVNSHIDYETFMKENIYVERAFVLPDDDLNVYNNVVNRGLYNFNDDKTHHAEIIVTDANNNRASLSFNVKAQPEKPQEITEPGEKEFKVMPYNKSNRFTSENISVNIPSGALYDTLDFSYKVEKGKNDMLSDLHYIHNKYTPLQKAYTLSIKPGLIVIGKESKMLIIKLDDDQGRKAVPSSWDGEYLSAEVLSFGRFYIGIDTTAPFISPGGWVPGTNIAGKREIKMNVTDGLSGIKSYEPMVDGNWALFEYNSKNDQLIYKFDDKRIKRGIKHTLSLKVSDNKDNFSIYKCSFIW